MWLIIAVISNNHCTKPHQRRECSPTGFFSRICGVSIFQKKKKKFLKIYENCNVLAHCCVECALFFSFLKEKAWKDDTLNIRLRSASLGFLGGSESKTSACNMGHPGLNPGSGRSPGEGNGKPTPVPLPGKPHGQRSLVGCSPWRHKEADVTERLHFHFLCKKNFWWKCPFQKHFKKVFT